MTTGTPAIPLNASTIDQLPPAVRVPTYDRRAIQQGIVHIGVGGFHRAHQAVYLDDLLHGTGAEAFGICGVGLLPHDRRMRDALRMQDYLYTVVARSAAGEEARVIGSIVDFLFAPDDPQAVLNRMASPQTRIVSLTVTEAGYCVNQVSGELDDQHPDIVHDRQHPHEPRGTFGYLAEALHRRRTLGLQPFTVMSCDNLLNNGALCRRVLLAFMRGRDPSLADWVAEHGAFPNSMVDRITPATTDADRHRLREQFGIDDAWPAVCEPYRQWVIEDHFPLGRPAWETVGAQLVADVEPYERMKIRLLNGSHQVMCYIGMLLGYRHAPQAMADPQINSLLQRFMDVEVTPLLPPVPGVDLAEYKQTLRTRFANPAVNDQLARIGTDGSARIAEFVLPTAADQLERDGPVRIAAFTVAAWIRYLTAGRDDVGGEIPISDAGAAAVRQRFEQGPGDVSAVLAMGQLFSGSLAGSRRFAEQVNDALRTFHSQGARAALTQCLASAD